jgi:type IV pilus assembly protein PilV
MTNMKIHAGFTLIEVLVAVVVLAGGLLGLAALQATTVRNNQSAYHRSLATQLAYDMSDRMRSNIVGVNAGNYNDKAATNDVCEGVNNCTAAQIAGYDLALWNGATGLGQLPDGKGLVCIDSTPTDGTGTLNAGQKMCDGLGSEYAIKVWWDDDRSGNTTLFSMSFRP